MTTSKGQPARLIYINGGARGFLVGIDPRELERVLKAEPVEVAIEA